MDSAAACPPSPGAVLPGDAGSGLSGADEEADGELPGGVEEEGDVSAAAEVPRSLGEHGAAGMDVPGAPGLPALASPAAAADGLASPAAAARTASRGEETAHETRGEAAADVQTGSRRDAGQVRDLPACTAFVGKRLQLFPLLCTALVQESSLGAYFLFSRVLLGGHKCSDFPDLVPLVPS